MRKNMELVWTSSNAIGIVNFIYFLLKYARFKARESLNVVH